MSDGIECRVRSYANLEHDTEILETWNLPRLGEQFGRYQFKLGDSVDSP